MNHFQKCILTTCLLTSIPTYSDNVANGTINISGVVVKSLTVEAPVGLRFGEIVKPNSNSTTSVTILVTNQASGDFTVTYGDKSTPDASASTTGALSATATSNRQEIGPGKIIVSGEPSYYFSATTPGIGLATVSGPNVGVNMSVDVSSPNSRQLDPTTGENYFYVGGTFSALSGTPVGTYDGTIEITVIYD